MRGQRQFLGTILLIAAVVSLGAGCFSRPGNGDVTTPTTPTPPKPKSVLTGLEYDTAGPLTAVMIENHPAARPQSGLLQADLVYECQAEGGITRFMALYHSRPAEVIGPVRSARTYFVQWAKEWGAAYAHCGGSNDGLATIRRLGLIDLDEMSGSAFWRDKTRSSPHNLYSKTANLTERIGTRKTAEPAARWQFGDWAAQPAKGLTIDYGHKYKVTYTYTDHAYSRSMNGTPHVDRETRTNIAPANIIVQFVKSKVVDSEGRLEITTISSGKAILLTAGTYSEGTWSKADEKSPTLFRTADGKELTLAPGQTWIQVVPTTATVTELK